MVHTQAQRGATFAARLQQRCQRLVYLPQFGGILGVGVFQLLVHAAGIHEVAGIDAHLLRSPGGHVCGAGIEVHVGHQRHIHTHFLKTRGDIGHVGGFAFTLRGEAHYLAAGARYGRGTLCRRFGVGRRSVGHRLQAHGIPSPYAHIADLHLARKASPVVVSAHFSVGFETVFQFRQAFVGFHYLG